MPNSFSQYLHHQQSPEILMRFPRLLFVYYLINRLLVLRTWYVRRVLRNVISSFQAPKSFLDAGCGMGDFIFSIPEVRSIDSVTGIDISPSNIALCNRLADALKKKNWLFTQQNLNDASIPEKQDIILCSAVLMYVENDIDLLKRFNNALSEGGKLILYVPVNYRRHLSLYKRFSKHNGFDYDETFGRPHTYTDATIEQRILSSGLIIEERRHSFGRVASIMFEISALFEWHFKSQHVLFTIPLLPVYILFLPLHFIFMGMDFIGTRTTGNGCIIVAKKP